MFKLASVYLISMFCSCSTLSCLSQKTNFIIIIIIIIINNDNNNNNNNNNRNDNNNKSFLQPPLKTFWCALY